MFKTFLISWKRNFGDENGSVALFVLMPFGLLILGNLLFHGGTIIESLPIVGILGTPVRFMGMLWLMFFGIGNSFIGWLVLIAIFHCPLFSLLTIPLVKLNDNPDIEVDDNESKLIDVTKKLTFIIRIFSICVSTVLAAIAAPFILPALNSLTVVGGIHIYQPLTMLMHLLLETINN